MSTCFTSRGSEVRVLQRAPLYRERRIFTHEKNDFNVNFNCFIIIEPLFTFKLHKENEYYKKVITDLGSEELIYFPELYSDGYIEQINVHNCMWAIETCECSLPAED